MSDERLRFSRLEQAELDPGALPAPFQDATSDLVRHLTLSWLRLTADDGLVGQAPARVPPVLLDALLGEGPYPLDRWWHRLFWLLRDLGHRNPTTAGALFGLDMAMRDILAQRAGLPWHRFNGAARDAVAAYASGGGTNLSADELVAEMTALADAGFGIVKMKVGTAFGTRADADVERVRRVRTAIGQHVGLALDANQAFAPAAALEFAQRVAPFGIEWLEEPVHAADRPAIRQVCQLTPIPIAMGDSEHHWLAFRGLVEDGVFHAQPNPMALPGFARWKEAVDFINLKSRLWTCGGLAHVSSAYVATQAEGMVEYLAPVAEHLATCFAEKPEIGRGVVRLPDRPGVGLVAASQPTSAAHQA